MKILITGARGQLGHTLPTYLRAHDVVALSHEQLDISSLAAVRDALAARRPDLVINAAAYNNVDGAETDADGAFVVNALGPRNLAVVTAAWSMRVLHVSTDYVFDGTATRPYHEFDRPAPRSVYGHSKWAGEEAVRIHNPRHYIVRTAWLFHTIGRNFANTIRGLAERPEVRVVHDQIGSPTYVPHLAAAIGRLVATDAYGTYHLAGHGGASWYDLTRALYDALGLTTPVHPITTAAFPRPAPRPQYSVLTTLQDPAITLPPWQEGVEAYAAAVRAAR